MQLDNILNILDSRKYKKDYKPDHEQILLSIKGKTIGVKESFVIFSGLPKNGKSTFCNATIASCLSTQDNIFGIKLHVNINTDKIALFDTESSEYSFYKNMDRIKQMANINQLHSNFDAYMLREDNNKQIKQMIAAYLHNNSNCKVIFIDGLLDLLIDYNEVKESRELINYLKAITKKYKILVVGVLHLGKKDLQTLGHMGSLSDRYANSVLKIEKNKELQAFVLSSTFLRDSDDFEPITIKYFDTGWQEIDVQDQQPIKKTIHTMSDYDHRSIIKKIMLEKGLNYTKLVDDIKESENIGTNKAKELVKLWINKGFIYKKEQLYFY